MANFNIQRNKNDQNQRSVLKLIPGKQQWLLYFSCGIALCALPGCGSSTKEIGRLPISGTVVRSKSNLPVTGSISFLPKEKGPAATTKITDGAYQFSRESGPLSGQYRVLVSTQTGINQANATADSDEAEAVLGKTNSAEWTFSLIILPDTKALKPFVLDAKDSSPK